MKNLKGFLKFGLLLTVVLTFQSAFSQENYVPGYVIKNNSDTLFGLVDYRNWKYNPDQIKFKSGIESNPVYYSPLDITEFWVEGEIYVSGIINTEISPRQTDHLVTNPQAIIKVDTTFLQTLIRGDKSLYYYENYAGIENFYIKMDTVFDLLIYKRYQKLQDGKPVLAENRIYLGQLTLYLNDCATINSKLENTSYTKKGLIKLFQYYYECSPSDISFQKKVEKVRAEVGILAGASLNSLQFSSVYFDYLVNAGFSPSTSFSSGVFFDFVLPRSAGKWSFNNEILFVNYNFTGSFEEFVHENNYSVTTTQMGNFYLKINNLVRFKFPVGRLFFLVNAGVSNGFSLKETNYKRKESTFYDYVYIHEGLALEDTRKLEQGFIFGTGVKYDRFSLEIRYESGNGMTEYMSLKSLTNNYYLLFGYRL